MSSEAAQPCPGASTPQLQGPIPRRSDESLVVRGERQAHDLRAKAGQPCHLALQGQAPQLDGQINPGSCEESSIGRECERVEPVGISFERVNGPLRTKIM